MATTPSTESTSSQKRKRDPNSVSPSDILINYKEDKQENVIAKPKLRQMDMSETTFETQHQFLKGTRKILNSKLKKNYTPKVVPIRKSKRVKKLNNFEVHDQTSNSESIDYLNDTNTENESESITKFATPNRFNTLSSQDDNSTQKNQDSIQHNIDKNSTDNQKNKQHRNNNSQEKAPPIYVDTNAIKDLIALLKEDPNTSEFIISSNNIDQQIIYAKNVQQFTNIKSKLKEKNLKFFTYSLKTQRNKLLVLKGLNNVFSEQEILEELKNSVDETVNIIKIEKLNPSNNTEKNNHLLIQITHDSSTNSITKLITLAHQLIRWKGGNHTENTKPSSATIVNA